MRPHVTHPALRVPFRCGVKRLFLVGILLTQAACSSTTFFYNRLDTIINWYVDDYVTLTKDQRADFDRRLATLLDWHRREELPRYTALLTQFEMGLDPTLEATTVEYLFTELSNAADRLEVRTLDLMIEFGETLSPEQRLEFMAELQREQEEQRETLLERTDAEYQDDARERLSDNLARFMGRLSADQKTGIEEHVQAYRRFDGPWLDDRARWIAQLDAILTQGDPDWPVQVRAVLAGRESARSADYIRVYENNSRVSRAVFRDVINLRSAKQDQRLRRKINDYRDDFVVLTEQADKRSVKQ